VTHIAIIDYELGNVKSIINALEKVGANFVLTRNDSEILNSDGVILPGVGAFSHGVSKLKEYSLDKIIIQYAKQKKPLLGNCLGMQMLFTESEEFGTTQGLNLISGKIKKLKTLNSSFRKLPHVSWNEILEPTYLAWNNTIMEGLNSSSNMYFVHTYAAQPDNQEYVLSTTEYSNYKFCSSVKKENIYGCQFHPEKSATDGLLIMKNFVKICKEFQDG